LTRADAEALDATDSLALWRRAFVIDDTGPIYMDGNSLGRPAHVTANRLRAAVDEWGQRLVGAWHSWIDLPVRVGDRLAEVALGAAPGQVIVADSTTVNLYKLAAAAIDARPDRWVIVGDREDFPTDRYLLEGLARATGRELRLMRTDPVEGASVYDLAAAVDPDVALVCLSHVNYRSASRVDMASLSAVAHDAGALILWDLSHSAGAVPLRLDRDGVDLAAGCTYKYLNAGPGAPAFLYVRRELQRQLNQPIWGWFGQRDQFAMGQGYKPQGDVRRFLSGSPPVLGMVAVESAIGVLAGAGIEALWAKSQRLTDLLIDRYDAWLAPLGCRLASPRDPARRGAHVAIGHPRAYQVCRWLIDNRQVVPDFRPPDVIRFGPAPIYTRFVDVWDACARLRDVLVSGDYLDVEASPSPGRVT
jgi:kynureninase